MVENQAIEMLMALLERLEGRCFMLAFKLTHSTLVLRLLNGSTTQSIADTILEALR